MSPKEDRWTDLPLFIAVARCESFVEASRRTGTPASSVSRAVARLEQTLGVRLFQRTSRRVALTHEGTKLLERAGPLADEIDGVLDAVADREDEPSGRLRITAPVVSGAEQIGPALVSFAAKYPRVSVELHLTNAVLDLIEDGFDLGFRAGPVADGELVARRVWSVPYTVAASPRFIKQKLRGARRIGARALQDLPAVLTEGYPVWRFVRTDGTREEVRPASRFQVNDPRVAIEAARQNLGMVCAPRAAIAGTELVPITIDEGEPEARELYAVFPSRRLLPRRVRLAIEWIVASLDRPERLGR